MTITDTVAVEPVAEDQRRHREGFWRFVLDSAEPWHREHLSQLLGTWDGYNVAHFDSRLVRPIILLAEPSVPNRYGQCSPVSSYGARSEIRIRPSLLSGTHPHIDPTAPIEGRLRFALDVLLHETIHQHQQEITGKTDPGYHGHGPAFRDTANRIGTALNLPPVRTSKRRGPEAELPSCSQWPHNVRPTGHYLGAYRLPTVPAVRDVCTRCNGTGKEPANTNVPPPGTTGEGKIKEMEN